MESLKPVLRLVVDDHLAALAATEAEIPEESARWELLANAVSTLIDRRPRTTSARAISG